MIAHDTNDMSINAATIELLRIINATTTTRGLISGVTSFLKNWLGCDAIGIRLSEGEDFPYYETAGFPEKFVRAERFLCSHDATGGINRDGDGNPVLDCMCGNIIRSRFDPSKEFFTPHGSFWSNSTTDLLASTSDADRQARTRNRCNGEGYESVGLFPLRLGVNTFGLLQVNHKGKGLFTPEKLAFLEAFADNLAIRLAHLRTEEALQEREEHYRMIVENSRDGILITNPDGTIYSANPEACTILGRTEAEITSLGRSGITDPNDQRLPAALKQRRMTGRFQGELNFLKADGHTFPVDMSSGAFMNSRGEERSIIIFRDITDRVQAEERLHELSQAVEQSPVSVMITDTAGSIEYVNPKFVEVTGYAPDEVVGKNPNILRSGHTSAEEYKQLWDTITSGGEWHGIFRNRKKGGELCWESARISPIVNAAGKTTHYLAVKEDITERMLAEEAIRASELKLKNAQRYARMGSWTWNVKTNQLDWSDEMFRIFGVDKDTFTGSLEDVIARAIHPDDRATVEDSNRSVIHDKKPIPLEYRIVWPDGSIHIVWGEAGELQTDAAGDSVLLSGTVQEITERKHVEAQLKESSDMLAKLSAQVPGVIYQYRLYPDGRSAFPYASPGMYDIYEVTPEEVREDATVVFGRIHPDDVEMITASIMESARTLQLYHSEFRVVLPRQGLRWRLCDAKPERLDDGSTLWYGIISDNTDRKDTEENLRRMESRLRQSEKMEAVGQLAGGIAHDFNNVLGGIIGFTDLSLNYVEPGSVLESNLHKVLKAADRAKHLVKQILAFSRQGNPQKTVTSIGTIVKEVLDLLTPSIPSSVLIAAELEEPLPPVLADPTQIHQALLNLATNAVHAMNRKGTLTVKLSSVQLHRVEHGRSGDLLPGKYIVLSVGDTGCGMDDATLSKAFEPFFTTKPVGEGTGMGLSVVLGIVQSHGGDLQIESRPGMGTTITMYLPTAEAGLFDTSASEGLTTAAGSEHVLFVDDEPMLVEMAGNALTRLGYRYTGMSDSTAALEFIRERGAEIDILVTDQTMPSITGLELVREAHSVKKDMPVILCTGFSSEITAERTTALNINLLIMKPYGAREITSAVRNVLDRRM